GRPRTRAVEPAPALLYNCRPLRTSDPGGSHGGWTMPGKNYVGKGGQLAVMGEFLLRGYNVAMPEVDVGDDIFVVHDRKGTMWRIQVKTAVGKTRGYGHSGRFAVARPQLQLLKKPDLFYVFTLRTGRHWEFVIIPLQPLYDEHRMNPVGPLSRNNVILNLRFREGDVFCAGRSFRNYRNNWDWWPVIDHP